METTLCELGIQNRHAMIVVPHRRPVQVSRLQSSSSSSPYHAGDSSGGGGYFGYLRTIMSYVNPLSYLGGNTTTSRQEQEPNEGPQQLGMFFLFHPMSSQDLDWEWLHRHFHLSLCSSVISDLGNYLYISVKQATDLVHGVSAILFLVTEAKKRLMRALQTCCEGGPDHLVPMSTLLGASRVHLMIEMFFGTGTPQSLEVMTGNKVWYKVSESKLVGIPETNATIGSLRTWGVEYGGKINL